MQTLTETNTLLDLHDFRILVLFLSTTHVTVCPPQASRQQVLKLRGGGQLPQVKLLQDLTVTAATYSHDAVCQKSMNTLNAKVIQFKSESKDWD